MATAITPNNNNNNLSKKRKTLPLALQQAHQHFHSLADLLPESLWKNIPQDLLNKKEYRKFISVDEKCFILEQERLAEELIEKRRLVEKEVYRWNEFSTSKFIQFCIVWIQFCSD